MSKIKTHSSSKKRFRITKKGNVKMSHAFRRHRLISKSKSARKRHKNTAFASSADSAVIRQMLPYK